LSALCRPTARQIHEIALEIAINVVRVLLILDEGAVDEDLSDPNLPQLPNEDLDVTQKLVTPATVPVRVAAHRALHEERFAHLAEREFVVARGQAPVHVEVRQHPCPPVASREMVSAVLGRT
jgi:hypothetical protein